MELKNVSKYIAGPGRVFMTVLIVLIAVSVVQTFAMVVIETFVYAEQRTARKSKPPRTEEEKRIDRIRQASRQFLPDGTIHLVYEPRSKDGRIIEPRTEQIYDINDNLLWEGPRDQRPYEYLSWAEQLRRYSDAFDVMQIKQMQMLTPLFSRSIEVPIGSLNNTEQIWRYRPGEECFEGYAVGGGRIGFIGAEGFVDSKSKVKPLGEFRFFTAWCPGDSSSPTLLWQTGRRVYQINFEKRQTELLFESADSDIETISLHAWRGLKPGTNDYTDSKKYRPLLVCITRDAVHHLILREPDQRLSVAGPRRSFAATRQAIFAYRSWADVYSVPSMAVSPQLYEEWLEQHYNKPQKRWMELYRVADDGAVQLLNRYDWTMPAPDRPLHLESLLATQRLACYFSPPLYRLVVRLLGRNFWSNVEQAGRQGDFFCNILQFPLWLRPLNSPVNWALSALMMGFVFWHSWPRRTSNAKLIFWLVFVGLFNVAGLLTYLALNHTAVIKCPACGRRRGLAQSDCIRCNAPLPTPKPRELDLVLKSCC